MAKQTYQLLARLADRGMGETYLARTGEGSTARLVALERLPRAKAGDAAIVRTFLESARAGALLSHPNVVQILDAGRLGSSYFVASEFVDGPDDHRQGGEEADCESCGYVVPGAASA